MFLSCSFDRDLTKLNIKKKNCPLIPLFFNAVPKIYDVIPDTTRLQNLSLKLVSKTLFVSFFHSFPTSLTILISLAWKKKPVMNSTGV